MSPEKMRVTLYRAHKYAGVAQIRGPRSWTTSLDYAKQYQSGYFGRRYGGQCLYRADLSLDRQTVADIRAGKASDEVGEALADVLTIMGVDLSYIEAHDGMHLLLQEAIPLLRALGLRWIVFDEYGFDEWLQLDAARISVEEMV